MISRRHIVVSIAAVALSPVSFINAMALPTTPPLPPIKPLPARKRETILTAIRELKEIWWDTDPGLQPAIERLIIYREIRLAFFEEDAVDRLHEIIRTCRPYDRRFARSAIEDRLAGMQDWLPARVLDRSES